MDRWQNKVAVITGASSGIGAACALDLVKAGMIVVGLARQVKRIQELCFSLPVHLQKKFHSIKCDVTCEVDILNAFAWIEKHLGGVDILINNAGIAFNIHLLSENNTKILKDSFDTNVIGVALCTREAFRSMKKRNFDGHVIIVNSIAGHKVPPNMGDSTYNIYTATKFSLTAMTDVYQQEFQINKTNIKITSISPGLVDTNFFSNELRIKFKNATFLRAEDVSSAILYCIQTPPHVQVHELIIKPLGSKL